MAEEEAKIRIVLDPSSMSIADTMLDLEPAATVSPSQWVVGQRWTTDAEAKKLGMNALVDATAGERAAERRDALAPPSVRRRTPPTPVERLAEKKREIEKDFEAVDLGKMLERNRTAMKNFFLRNPNVLEAVSGTQALTSIAGAIKQLSDTLADVGRKIHLVGTAVGLGSVTAPLAQIAALPQVAGTALRATRETAKELAGAAGLAGFVPGAGDVGAIGKFLLDYETQEAGRRVQLELFRSARYAKLFGNLLGSIVGE